MVPFHGSGNYPENSPRSAGRLTAVENKPSKRCCDLQYTRRAISEDDSQQAVDIGESDKTRSICCLADLAASGPPCCPRTLHHVPLAAGRSELLSKLIEKPSAASVVVMSELKPRELDNLKTKTTSGVARIELF
ncbi:uncharacterized protein LOC129748277 [Uranotaenia lowii]|uniref:uncharacterized protein LOC129748277 n=1 Tax=Uranotaenia lowii TaxID=190385 RepID=UPI00247A5233|nr:uncharacterized protein LOC129748277 [Uranotaenia lowii]